MDMVGVLEGIAIQVWVDEDEGLLAVAAIGETNAAFLQWMTKRTQIRISIPESLIEDQEPNIAAAMSICFDRHRLYLDSAFQSLTLLLGTCDSFLTHDTSTPVSLGFFILIQISFLDCGDEFREFGLVF